MHFAFTAPRGRAFCLLVASCCAAVPLVLGLPLVYWQADRELAQSIEQARTEALARIDTMLDNAADAAERSVGLLGQPCAAVELGLRRRVATEPSIRSINLAQNGVVYCTSLAGRYNAPEEVSRYQDGRLRLRDGNELTPDRAILIYRRQTPDGSVLVSIDGTHLQNILQLASQQVPMTLTIGDMRMLPDGSMVVADRIDDSDENQTILPSPRYPLTIASHAPTDAGFARIADAYPPMLALLLLLGGLAGFAGYRLSVSGTSPRAELSRALKANEFVPYYQLLFDCNDLRWSGVEVLMRWQHPREGILPPDQFIPLAERSGLIVPMTRMMFERARHELSALCDVLPPHFHVGLNITAAHCRTRELIEDCQRFLDAFPPGQITLTLELTEREMFEPTPFTNELFGELRQMGVCIAIDDFGTGHCTLAYLRAFRIDSLKIDRSFVSMVGTDALSRHLLDNIVDLATRLKLGVIAEGIENAEQRDYLRERGIEVLQGYLFAKPVPAPILMSMLEQPPPLAA